MPLTTSRSVHNYNNIAMKKGIARDDNYETYYKYLRESIIKILKTSKTRLNDAGKSFSLAIL